MGRKWTQFVGTIGARKFYFAIIAFITFMNGCTIIVTSKLPFLDTYSCELGYTSCRKLNPSIRYKEEFLHHIIMK